MTRALAAVEDAIWLMRSAGLTAYTLHAVGSAPFALGALAFWNAAATPRLPAMACAGWAALMVVLLIWMSAWRAMYAVRLREILFGAGVRAPGAALVMRCARGQAAVAGWKILVLPLAVSAILPLSRVVAYFRMSAVWADRPVPEMLDAARKHSRFDSATNWWALILLSGFSLFVFVNMVALLFSLPLLVRALTGMESTFSRMGSQLVSQPLFWVTSVLATWMLVDPLLQAYYTVRSFEAHSVRSGADLTARLRGMARPIAALLMIGWIGAHMELRAAIAPEQLDHAVQQTLQSHDYDWRLPVDEKDQSKASWLVRFTDRVLDQVSRAWREFLDWLDSLFGRDDGSSAGGGPPNASGGPLYLLIVVFAVAAGGFVVWRLLARRQGASSAAPAAPAAAAIDLDDHNLTADRLPEDEWLALAERLAASGDLRAALRALYLSNLAWLGTRQLITIHWGKTNHDYQREFTRRGRSAPHAAGLLAHNIRSFERVWYGAHAAAPDDLGEFRRRVEEMKGMFA